MKIYCDKCRVFLGHTSPLADTAIALETCPECKGNEPQRRSFKMPVVCAWCSRLIRVGAANYPDAVSHGICPDCKKKVQAEVDEYLERLESKNTQR